MKILLVTNRFDQGGVTNVMRDIASHLPQHYEPILAAVKRSDHDLAIKREFPNAVTGIAEVARRMREADIVHSHQRLPSIIFPLTRSRARLIEHVHNQFTNHRALSFRTETVVAVSEQISEGLKRNYPHVSSPVVIHNGVPDPGSLGSTQPRADQGLRLISAGRLSAQKDPDRLLDLVEQLVEMSADIRARWVGNGPLRDDFERSVERRRLTDHVTLVPWLPRDDLLREVGQADALLLTSRWEGLPLICLEAAALARPILTTDCGDIATHVIENHAGLVWKNDVSSADFARQVLSQSEADRSAMSNQSRQMYLRNFSVERMIREIIDVYDR